MSRVKLVAAIAFAAAVAIGTRIDSTRPVPPVRHPGIMVADLHVHPYPGDGALPVSELQREARRRGLDLIAVTAHNNRLGLKLGAVMPLDPDGPIIVSGQEITTPTFHMVAVGIDRGIDWRLSARDAIAAIHAQGGVAIAAHPVRRSWRDNDPSALSALDGAEVAHPSNRRTYSAGRDEFLQFFDRVRSVNPGVAPIGSSDFHMTAPLGLCRTYLLVNERSAAGALDAIRQGRTVAADPHGRLFGAPEHIAMVEAFRAATGPVPAVPGLDRLVALAALIALGAAALPRSSYR